MKKACVLVLLAYLLIACSWWQQNVVPAAKCAEAAISQQVGPLVEKVLEVLLTAGDDWSKLLSVVGPVGSDVLKCAIQAAMARLAPVHESAVLGDAKQLAQWRAAKRAQLWLNEHK